MTLTLERAHVVFQALDVHPERMGWRAHGRRGRALPRSTFAMWMRPGRSCKEVDATRCRFDMSMRSSLRKHMRHERPEESSFPGR